MIIHLFKSRILGFVEYRIAGIYHANSTALAQLDGVYTKFLKAVGLSFEEALLEFGLAPLNARRDIAMLGVIHRTVLGLGPEHFRKFFVPAERSTNPSGRANLRRHNMQLRSYRRGAFLEIMSHSLLGAIDVYNLLPQYVVAVEDVKTFQNRLQQMLKAAATNQMRGWPTLLSNRLILFQYPLREFGGFEGFGGVTNGYSEHAMMDMPTNACITNWLEFGQ